MKAADGRSITVSAFRHGYTAGSGYQPPPSGMECVALTLVVVNGSQQPWGLPFDEVMLQDAHSPQTWDINGSTEVGGFQSVCGAGDAPEGLDPGASLTITEVYQVPSGIALIATWSPDSGTTTFVTALS
jgi:hypothetical protein